MPTIEEVQAHNRALRDRNGELTEEAKVYRKSYIKMGEELEGQRAINERLRIKLSGLEFEYNNCVARLNDNGIM